MYDQEGNINDVDQTIKEFLKIAGLSEDVLNTPSQKEEIEQFCIENHVASTFKRYMTTQSPLEVSIPSARWYVAVEINDQWKPISLDASGEVKYGKPSKTKDVCAVKGKPPIPIKPTCTNKWKPQGKNTYGPPQRPPPPPPPIPTSTFTNIAVKPKTSIKDELKHKNCLEGKGLKHIETIDPKSSNSDGILNALREALDVIKDANISGDSSSDDNEPFSDEDWSD